MSKPTTEAEGKPPESGDGDEGVDFLYRAMCKKPKSILPILVVVLSRSEMDQTVEFGRHDTSS